MDCVAKESPSDIQLSRLLSKRLDKKRSVYGKLGLSFCRKQSLRINTILDVNK